MLSAKHLFSILRVLERCERANSVQAFAVNTLDAIEREFGFSRANFFVVEVPVSRPQVRDPVSLGLLKRHLRSYEAFASTDLFASERAVSILRKCGVATLAELASGATPVERKYVAEFLTPQSIGSQISLWIETTLSVQGVFSFFHSMQNAFGGNDRAKLLALRPHLSNLLERNVQEKHERVLPTSPFGLSAREAQVSKLVAEGLGNREIAARLCIEHDTVKKHVSNALRKSKVANRTQLAARWHVLPTPCE